MSKFTGADQLQTRLKWVRDRGSKRIGGAMIRAGMRVIGGAMRSACPGSISAEIGSRRLPTAGNVLRGVVGLGVGGVQSRIENPHGHFLAAGTIFIRARPFIRNAIASSTGSAESAMQTAGAKALSKMNVTG